MDNNFPSYVNFYSSIKSISILDLKKLLEEKGWLSRKESWTDFELNNNWSQFSLIKSTDDELLLNGFIKNPSINYFVLIELLKKSNVEFIAELYDEAGEIKYNNQSSIIKKDNMKLSFFIIDLKVTYCNTIFLVLILSPI